MLRLKIKNAFSSFRLEFELSLLIYNFGYELIAFMYIIVLDLAESKILTRIHFTHTQACVCK